jgi:KUP system potassium uptake protein
MVMYYVWGFIFIIPLAFLIFFGTLDGAFWGGTPHPYHTDLATLQKFPQGAWFPFTVGIVMTCFMAFWRWGMSKKRTYEWDRRVRLSQLLRRDGEIPLDKGEGAFILGERNPLSESQEYSEKTPYLEKALTDKVMTNSTPSADPSGSKSSTSGDSMAILPTNSTDSGVLRRRVQGLYLRMTDTPVARLPGISIYYTTAPTSHAHAPHTFRHFLEHFPALHQTCIFLHVRTAAQPHVPTEEKLAMEASPLWDGVWRGVYRVGYMETPDFTTSEFTISLFEKLGRQVEGLTHVLQYTELKAKREREKRGDKWIAKFPEIVRAWLVDVLWNGVDEIVGGVGKGWKVPVGEVLSVGAVAEV